ncbi:two-component system C4-dicarboxylate transport response regulator DctD [Hasllibacter halocynthiae]|uniref:Nif-specific regulatory protein n=1 Tax=Hasllibacter halocynthiae TaxID=595589 RepID=A0A2T0WZE1_9RHOB|nr:sigma-54 dependent transcriptional regulator [Hasllibacter halocynthiae]PRY92037.1 two-component system C4-dicarboxylate transport response regulator DctD [Hasllibacter halocynthiae]
MTGTVLFVDDEEHIRLAVAQALDLADLPHQCLADPSLALARIGHDADAVLLTDIRMPGMDGTELMRRALEVDPDFPVILVTGHGDVDLAVASMKAGAYDFVQKPFETEDLVERARRALEKRRLTLENRALRRALPRAAPEGTRLVTRSDAMATLSARVDALAGADLDVLIWGATGTGKERVARRLHALGARSGGTFVHVNCAALPDGLVESELFGHEVGAFPGALRARHGKVEHASRGILCLDEIDSLPLPLQPKLLHVLEHRAVTRLGSNDPRPVDMRVIAIAQDDLRARSEAGTFRADLYHLLGPAEIRVPSLRERREDIPALFAELCADAAARHERPLLEVPAHLLSALAMRDWPGNVRELRGAAERYVLGLGAELRGAGPPVAAGLAEGMAAHERALIAAAIAANGGRLRPTYEALGISRRTLYEKMQRHGLERTEAGSEEEEDAPAPAGGRL